MSQHRPVPGIAQGPREFSPSSFVPMQSPIGQPQQAPVVSESMQDLAMEIYARLAVNHITADAGGSHDSGALRELAQEAQTAARIYFQAMGVPTNG